MKTNEFQRNGKCKIGSLSHKLMRNRLYLLSWVPRKCFSPLRTFYTRKYFILFWNFSLEHVTELFSCLQPFCFTLALLKSLSAAHYLIYNFTESKDVRELGKRKEEIKMLEFNTTFLNDLEKGHLFLFHSILYFRV